MTVERDIAGFALPFAAGTFVAAYAFTGPAGIATHYVQSALLITAVCLTIFLFHPARKGVPAAWSWGIIAVLSASCGMLTGLSHNILEVSDLPGSVTMEWTAGLSRHMKEMISALPFKDPQSGAILTAFITGDRHLLATGTTKAFRDSGASHILALSGLHLGMIYGILKGLLSVCGNSPHARTVRSIATILTCSIYTLATGASASITRALLFIILGETAGLTGRHRSTGGILWAALFLQLTFSPSSARDVGFQLSYAAMAGIAYVYPRLKSLWPDKGWSAYSPARWIWNSAAMSIACQLTTGPIAWLYFGTFPQYFLLTNLIALPLTGLIIPAGLLIMTLNALGICPEVMIYATEKLITWLTFALDTIASL